MTDKLNWTSEFVKAMTKAYGGESCPADIKEALVTGDVGPIYAVLKRYGMFAHEQLALDYVTLSADIDMNPGHDPKFYLDQYIKRRWCYIEFWRISNQALADKQRAA